ncbi:MAG: hypothetical protein ABSD31_05845 [Candidatus Binataceae bacterium]|jgi:hypothetical protein
MLKLADALGELEIVIGERARPVVAEVRARLVEASVRREQGDVAGALDIIQRAMERLASLAAQLDPEEGMMMTMIAQRFTSALTAGDHGTAKEAVDLMRRRAGDPKDDKNSDL